MAGRTHHVAQAARLADAVAENIEGGKLAGHFLARMRVEILDADDLMRALRLAQAASDDRFRGFARRVQKELEQEVRYESD